jgi:hypothetical protein
MSEQNYVMLLTASIDLARSAKRIKELERENALLRA